MSINFVAHNSLHKPDYFISQKNLSLYKLEKDFRIELFATK